MACSRPNSMNNAWSLIDMHARRKSSEQVVEGVEMNPLTAERTSLLSFTIAQYIAVWPLILGDCKRLENVETERVAVQSLTIWVADSGM